jgi:gliding motility-associated-like protein
LSSKYRVLLAVLLTLLAICTQAVFGQTKIVQKIVHINQQSVNVSLDKLTPNDCQVGAGSIAVSVSGGSGKYIYSWTGPSGFTSSQEDITNLSQGIYTLQVSDGSDCILSKQWEVVYACASGCKLVDVSTVTNSKTCSSNDGSINVAISGGSGAYSFMWYNKNFNIVGNTKTLTNAAPGTYYLEVTDTKNTSCTTMFYYYIESSLKVNFTTVSNTKCTIPYTGSIAAVVTGGSGSYSYQWQYPDGQKATAGGASLAGLRGGNYILIVKDKTSNCEVEQNIYLANTAAATLGIGEVISPATMCAPANGSVDVMITKGSGNYTYSWYEQSTGVSVSTAEDLTNAVASNYTVYVTDLLSGCNASKKFVIPDKTQKPEFILTKTDNTNCSAPFNGAIELVSAKSGTYAISWSNGAISQSIKTLAPGSYGISVTDKTTGCKSIINPSDVQAVNIKDLSEQPLEVTIDAVADNTKCITPNGSIQTSITSSSPTSISWTGPNGFISDQQDLSALAAGDYILTASIQCNTAPVIEAEEFTAQASSSIELDLRKIISDRDNNLDPSSIVITNMPRSGASASITNELLLRIQYQSAFQGIDSIQIRACDLMKACSENIITINVETISQSKQDGIVVYNAVAPNSIGNNKFMRIEYLPQVDNRVSIFNRWGDKVFEVQNYTNELPGKRFEGLNDSGKELPTGTYFYKIEFADATNPVMGYLSLKQ